MLASGSGSNAERLIKHFKQSELARIVIVGTDHADAGVVARAEQQGVPVHVFGAEELNGGAVAARLQHEKVDLVVLAGFLRLLPASFIRSFEGRIVNIHPALLPKYGGKGMFGRHVHMAVLEGPDHESGITIHLVNEQYDEGPVLFQATCPILPDDTPERLQQRVQWLEHEHYPQVVEALAEQLRR